MDNEKLLQALEQCKRVKNKNYKVSLNVMCASYFTDSILDNLKNTISKYLDCLDFVYLADSYGGMEPKYVDHVFVIFPFELELYKRYGVNVTYVGNPLFDEISKNNFSFSYNSNKPIIKISQLEQFILLV